jgi:hypothetical protein
MLPGDVKACKEKAERTQQMINLHLTECKLSERVLPYSDKQFKKAAIKWLVSTDQVCLPSCMPCHYFICISLAHPSSQTSEIQRND